MPKLPSPLPDDPNSPALLSTDLPSSEATPGGDLGHSETQRDFSDIEPLSERQLQAVELTMQGHTDLQIAQTLGINRRTLWRWKNLDDDYRRILNNARIQQYASAADRYQTLLSRATGILSQCLQDSADENRFRAATLVLSMAGCFRPLPPKFFLPNDKAPAERRQVPKRWPEPKLPYKCG
jgi:DNA-binding CsgD family transcriptional regulator